MKSLSYDKKKWALTGCLLVALGFNLSMHKHIEGVASAELASNSDDVVDSKVVTANGIATVKYIKIKDDQTLAVVTEGTICATCGNQFTLTTSFNKDNVDALNVALLKYVSASPVTVTPAPSTTTSGDVEKDVTERALSAIEKYCDKKDDKQEQLECYGDKFVSLMDTKKKITLDIGKLNDFYREHIENLIDSQMSESRSIMSRARRAAAGLTSLGLDDSMKDPAQMREDTLKVVENLLSGVPKKYNMIRKSLVSYETNLLKTEALDVQQTFVQARNTANPLDSVRLMQEAFLKRQDLAYLANGLNDANQYAFDKAVRYDKMDSSNADTYYKYFNAYAKQVIDGLSLNPTSFQIPGVNLQLPNSPLATTTLGDRIGNGGRIGAPVVTTPGTTTNGLTLIQTDPSAGSVTFGPQQAVTAEMVKMRQAVRNQYNLH
jgi:hypothetical protein